MDQATKTDVIGKIKLNPNKNRETEKHPHYKGLGEVHGRPVWAALWINTDATGAQWLNIDLSDRTPLPEQVAGAIGGAPQMAVPPVTGGQPVQAAPQQATDVPF